MFPSLEGLQILEGAVTLGSAYSLDDISDPEIRKFCYQELELRIGLGHELVQDMRTVSSLLYRLQDEQWTRSSGVEEMKKTAAAQKRASNTRSKHATDYNHNWRRIEELRNGLIQCDYVTLEKAEQQLRGLQKLNVERDIRYYAKPGQQTTAYSAFADPEASWIWKIQMLGSSLSTDPEDMERSLRIWERECEWIFSPNISLILHRYLARRLKWVHAFAALERWKEELLRTGEEIRRLGAWYDHKVKFFRAKAFWPERSGSWVDRGLHALHSELAEEWRVRRENLPALIRGAPAPIGALYQFDEQSDID